jgi:hypothetical protein
MQLMTVQKCISFLFYRVIERYFDILIKPEEFFFWNEENNMGITDPVELDPGCQPDRGLEIVHYRCCM